MNCLEMLVRTAHQVIISGARSMYGAPPKVSLSSSDQLRLIETLGKCTAEDVSLHESMRNNLQERLKNPDGKKAPVTYIEVFDHCLFTIGIFILHSNSKIPLHDHPGMTGMIKVLCGELKLTSYTKVETNQSSSPRLIVSHESQILTSSSPPAVLTAVERNFHQLEYVKGENDEKQPYAAFLDILSPPYNSFRNKPECNYYYPIKHTQSASDFPNGVKSLVELRPCLCPSEFYNDTAIFMGFFNLKNIFDDL